MDANDEPILIEHIEPLFVAVRDQKVVLFRELALLYSVATAALNCDIRVRDLMPSPSMASSWPRACSIRHSPRAVEVSVLVVRAFVRLRETLLTQKKLAKKFNELESRLSNYDVAIQQLLQAIRQLMDKPPAEPKPRIGLRT